MNKRYVVVVLDAPEYDVEIATAAIQATLTTLGYKPRLGSGEDVYYQASDIADDISVITLIETRDDDE